MTHSPLTEDVIVALLKRTSLPTLLVEGKDDVIIYRWIEYKLGDHNINVLPCNGRKTLLDVYERRSEFSTKKVAFVADRDMWLFTAIPSQYSGVIWTDGYSIENDLYEPSNLDIFLSEQEVLEIKKTLDELIKWYAFEVEEYRSGRDAKVAIHPNRVIDYNNFRLHTNFIIERGYIEPNIATIEEIRQEYKLKIRGKTLFELIARFTNIKNRVPKYSISALLDIALKGNSNNFRLERIILSAKQNLLS